MEFYNCSTQPVCCKCGNPLYAMDADYEKGEIDWTCSMRPCLLYGILFRQKLSTVVLTPVNVQ